MRSTKQCNDDHRLMQRLEWHGCEKAAPREDSALYSSERMGVQRRHLVGNARTPGYEQIQERTNAAPTHRAR